MKLNKFCTTLIISILSILVLCVPSLANTPELKSESAILFETTTGNVLYSKNATEKLYPAHLKQIIFHL